MTILDNFKAHINKNIYGGGKAAIERHRSRGKLLPRERINKIIDPG
jgi:acetyl-CoA carboxylase carboxyltransferase component